MAHLSNHRSIILYLSGLIVLLVGACYAIHIDLQALFFLHKVEITYGAWSLAHNIHFAAEYAVICVGLTTIGSITSYNLINENYIASLKNFNLHDLKKLLAAMILGGGTVYSHKPSYKYCARYYGKDDVLHAIFCDLVRQTYRINSETSKLKMKNSYITQVYSKRLVEDLLSFSPSYNTRNGCVNGDANYDCISLPTAKFLAESNYEVIRESIRLIASSNGSANYVIERKHNNHGYFIKPRFALGYLSPPQLLDDYRQVLEQIGIRTFRVFDKRFDNKGFLLNNSWDGLEIFSKIGGFIDKTRINSGWHKGMKRNTLLSALLSIHRMENNDFTVREDVTSMVEDYMYKLPETNQKNVHAELELANPSLQSARAIENLKKYFCKKKFCIFLFLRRSYSQGA